MKGLVLSLFPGVDLLGRAFEEEGFVVVRGPDPLWGGDIHDFHPPAGRFDGVVGGPPCQKYSAIARLNRERPKWDPPDLIPEFLRVVNEAWPLWWLMENVPEAPIPELDGYIEKSVLLRDVWVGGETRRLRRFTFGLRNSVPRFYVDELALHRPDPSPAVLASGARWVPGEGFIHQGHRRLRKRGRAVSLRSKEYFREACRLQGLPDDFDLPGFTVEEKIRALGNGVPLPMGRAVAQAVKRALNPQTQEAV